MTVWWQYFILVNAYPILCQILSVSTVSTFGVLYRHIDWLSQWHIYLIMVEWQNKKSIQSTPIDRTHVRLQYYCILTFHRYWLFSVNMHVSVKHKYEKEWRILRRNKNIRARLLLAKTGKTLLCKRYGFNIKWK